MRQGFVVSSLFASLLALALACEWIQNTGPDGNGRPTATIATPTAGTTYRGGDAISYSGSGSDPDDGALPAPNLTWWVDFHHDTHTHPFLPVTTGVASGTVTTPTIGETSANVWYRFYLVAVDAGGLADTVFRDVEPQTRTVTLATVPAGLQVTLDGQPRATPLTITGVVGMQREIGAVTPQTAGSTAYTFASWSDGGAATHAILTPAVNATYTVTYQANTPPSVSLTAPANGGSATVNTAVGVTASASDADGTLQLVEFFDGTTPIGSDASSPYGVTWTPQTTGTRQLTARATDDLGATTTSAAVSFTVTAAANAPPSVSLTAPPDGGSATVNTLVAVTAGASDADGTVDLVEFFDGTTPIGSDATSPYSISWAPQTTGPRQLTARATDDLGAMTTSAARSFTVTPSANAPPSVSLTAPPDGGSATVNTSVAVSATASDADGTVDLVEFFDGTTPIGSDATSPFSISWTPQTTGPRQLTARATDDLGAVTTSAARSFTVTAAVNAPPSVSLTAPPNGGSATVNTPVAVTANAGDADGTVDLVEFFDGTTPIGSDASSPYGITWTPQTSGARQLTARATDDLGATTTSAAVSFTVTPPSGTDTEPPVAILTSPADQSPSLSGTLTLTATASDNVGVVGVRFQVDGEDLGAEDVAAPYEAVLPATTAYTTGVHVLRARARDAAGNVSPWSVATVRFGGSVNLPAGFTRTTYTSGLTAPTAMAFAPDGRLFVCQQNGALRVVPAGGGALLATPFHTFTVTNSGEQGLLGVAFHPDFATNGYVYVYYTSPTPGNHNRVSRVVASSGNPDVSTGVETILLDDLPNVGTGGNHNGGALHFSPIDRKLYVAIGDQGSSSNAQSMTSRFGKMLRYNDDLTIPTDNPFYTTASGVYRAIWAFGLRNPFTFGFQPATGRMFINDVGQNAWEEINDGVAGSNYGWPTTEGYTSDPRFRGPIYAYEHGGTLVSGYAIVGAAFYNPTTATFPPAYVGNYFFGDYASGWVNRLDPSNGNAAYAFARIANDVFDVHVGSDGAVYVLANGGTSFVVYRYQYQ